MADGEAWTRCIHTPHLGHKVHNTETGLGTVTDIPAEKFFVPSADAIQTQPVKIATAHPVDLVR